MDRADRRSFMRYPPCGSWQASASHPAGHVSLRRQWVEWWRLVVRTGSTCSFLCEAWLGPHAATLWRHSFLESSLAPGAPVRDAQQGLQRLLLRQGRHAQHVVLLRHFWDAAELWAAVIRLGRVCVPL